MEDMEAFEHLHETLGEIGLWLGGITIVLGMAMTIRILIGIPCTKLCKYVTGFHKLFATLFIATFTAHRFTTDENPHITMLLGIILILIAFFISVIPVKQRFTKLFGPIKLLLVALAAFLLYTGHEILEEREDAEKHGVQQGEIGADEQEDADEDEEEGKLDASSGADIDTEKSDMADMTGEPDISSDEDTEDNKDEDKEKEEEKDKK